MKQWDTTQSAYTAQELQEHYPDAFDHAREHNADMEWETGYVVESVLEDFTDNVFPALGLGTLDRKHIDYSLDAYYGGSAGIMSGHCLYVDNLAIFHSALLGYSAVLDVQKDLPIVKIDRRSRLWNRCSFYFEGTGNRPGTEANVTLDDIEDLNQSEYDTLEAQADSLAEELVDWIRAVFAWIPSQVVREYEYLSSAEALIESAEANEWYFDESGRIIHVPGDAIDV